MSSLFAKLSRNPWPCAIIAWFVMFAAALAAWITFAVQQDMDLVRADYYEEELRFQKQLDRLNRTAAVRSEVAVGYASEKGEVTLRLPAAHSAQSPAGRILFYRPSDAALDFEVPLVVEASGLQRINLSAVRAGHWKMRVHWKVAGQDYFFEQVLVLDESKLDLTPAATKAK